MKNSPQPSAKKSPAGRVFRMGLNAVGVLCLLILGIYVEENLRGKSAWKDSKSALEAQREVLDWSAYIPPPVAADQNFFKAPKMAEWFVGKGSNELSGLLSLHSFEALTRQIGNTNAGVLLAEWLLRPSATNEDSRAMKMQDFKFGQISWSQALQQLVTAADARVSIDPRVSPPNSSVNIVWTNVTAQAALLALVCNANLRWAVNPDTGAAVITTADITNPVVGPDSVSMVLGTLKGAVGSFGEASEGFALSPYPLAQLSPMRISVPPDGIPAKAQMLRLIPPNWGLRVEPAGNTVRIWLSPPPIAAADYLQWSDQFRPQFDLISDALKRSDSRIEGDYDHLDHMPSINFSAVEPAARILADRAKCFLMLGQPDQALAEVTLLHNFLNSLARPNAKQITIPNAAGIATLRALYGETVAFGLRTQTWGEPQLTALEDQLSHVDMISLAWNAMESDRAWRCHFALTASRSEVAQSVDLGGVSGASSEKSGGLKNLIFKFMPEGWVYQNVARMAPLRQGDIDALDRAAGVVHPHQAHHAVQQDLAAFGTASPFTMLAKLETPPLEPTLTTTARVQALINEALVATALERFRLARGVYPDRLEELAPSLIAFLPADPINGQALHYRHLPGGHFQLYSIGWDEKDDNGASIDAKGNGDWLWGGH